MNSHALGFRALVALSLGAAIAAPAHAYLGSFTPNDGYHIQSSLFYGDVTYYNAGTYGPNAGGGSGPTQIAVDSGLWDLVSPVGAYFSSVADRNVAVAGFPPYPVVFANGKPTYMVGNHGPGRGDGNNLAFRNANTPGTGPAVYDYKLDTFDFGGVAPSSVISGKVETQFYFRPNPPQPSVNPAGTVDDRFTMTFADNAAISNVGLQWGYLRDNTVVYRTSSSNPWTTTSIIADDAGAQNSTSSTIWDGVKITIDITADTFDIDYFDFSASSWSNIVTGAALGMPMNNLTRLQWQLEDDNLGGLGGKNYFDDFGFKVVIPEPSALALVAMGAAMIVRRRRSS